MSYVENILMNNVRRMYEYIGSIENRCFGLSKPLGDTKLAEMVTVNSV